MRQGRWGMIAGLCLAVAQAVAQGVPPRPEAALVQVAAGEQPIRLAHAGVDVYAEGSLVHTVIDLTLSNPNARLLEGELRFPLHAGQTVTGFALDMSDGAMRAAVPVPKARGREVFEAVVRQGVDPALLEQTAGENFRLRVYPLRPGATRRVTIAITEWLTPGAQQRLKLALPLDFAGTPADVLDLHVRLHATDTSGVRVAGDLDGADIAMNGADTDVRLQRSDFRPSAERANALDISWPAPQGDTLLRERVDGQGYFHAEIQVPEQPAPRARPDDVTLIWDASGSGAKRDHEAELRLLGALFAWTPDVKVRLRVVRDAAEPERVFDVRRGDWQALRDALKAIAYDGASNAALWTAPASRWGGSGLALLFSDGLGNWGGPLPAANGDMTAYAVQAGAGGSAVFLRRWAESRGGRLLDLAALASDDALRLIQQRGSRLVRVDGQGFDQPAVASWRPDAGRLVIAGRFTAPSATLDLVLESGDGATSHRRVELAAPPRGDGPEAGFVAQRWARLRVDELLVQPELHHTEIAALGNRFGIVTPETSLIVLETLADYQRYEIVPPPGALRDAWDAGRRRTDAEKSAASARHLASLVDRFDAMQAWWDKDFPKDPPPSGVAKVTSAVPPHLVGSAAPAMAAPPAPAAPVEASRMASADAASRERRGESQRVEVTGAAVRPAPDARNKKAAESPADIRIAVQAWSPDAEGTRRLAQAAAADRYAVYLDQRLAAADSPAFYLDAAQVFAANGQRSLALRVLSNLAELRIEERGLLRVLAYRLEEMGETAEAIRLLRRVAELAPDEPQSWRDLGLAEATAGHWQAAVDALWRTASGTWSARFGDVDLVALGELDAIAALHKVDVSGVDGRLRRNLPLDVRVALAWDTDDTDIDLWVKDPNGEWVSYQNRLSRQGGRNSPDVTQGYGPEVFSLKKAIPGTYEVHARYYASHRQALGNTTNVMMRLSTGFGTPAEKHRDTIVRLQAARDDLLIGTFEVKL
jgi:Ca-activated chloride channel family protein